jgi:RimJ/RimL family protein N-acetyltransferase
VLGAGGPCYVCPVNIPLRTCEVRSWESRDVDPLVWHANNRNVSINLRDRFPFPYTRRDGREFIKLARNMRPESLFAIAVDGEAVGGIGFVLGHDVERVSTEVGYWLGEAYWGRGIATEALIAVTYYAIATHGFTRLFALPFAHNVASCRVLEKAGYTLEARLRNSAVKDGRICDQLQYAFIAPEIVPQHPASLPQR